MTLRTLAFTREEFAADRRPIMERADARLGPAVRAALDSGDWSEVLRQAERVFLLTATGEGAAPVEVAAALDDYLDSLRDTLAKVTDAPDREAQVTRLTVVVSTSAVNAGTAAAAATEDGVLLEWVTMHDRDVRATHRDADGQQVPPGGTFDIAGHELHYPGEPSGPPEVWINCRCVVRPAAGADMASSIKRAAISPEAEQAIVETFADTAVEDAPPEVEEDEEDLDLPDFTDEDWDALEVEVSWHGPLAPLDTVTGDRRKFAAGAITSRDLPVPLKFMPKDLPGHDESVVVGNIESIEERDGLIWGSGRFRFDDEATADAIDLIADYMLRGVSVDLDAVEVAYENEDGTPFDFDQEFFDPTAPRPIEVVTSGRIASSTLCAIPAFQEAFLALGSPTEPEADYDVFAGAVTAEFGAKVEGECLPCEALAMIESVSEEHAREFAGFLDEDETVPEAFVASDGTRYEFAEGGINVFAPGTKDGPGWITNPRETQRLRTYWTRGKGAAKIRWGAPGDYNRCRRQLAKYVTNPNFLAGTCANLHKVALGYWPGDHARMDKGLVSSGEAAPLWRIVEDAETLVASAGTLPPAAWFIDPELDGPTPFTVEDDGRVYGHLATWGTCHIGMGANCTTPPNSVAEYGYFRTGMLRTDDGDVPVGQITMGTGHAALSAGAKTAAGHYDDTGYAVADVAAGEDEHGIWVAGALRPDLTEDDVRALRSAALSGDWRPIRGNREMVAALAVNVPGFPIPRTQTAAVGGKQVALVASGIVEHETEVIDVGSATLDVTNAPAFAKAVIAEMKKEEARTARLAAARRLVRQARLAEARARIEQED